MSDKYMKDFNGEKIFCLEYDKETLRDMIIDKQEVIEYLEKEKDRLGSLFYERNEENIKLHHIIKEVREYITTIEDENIQYTIGWVKQDILQILDKVEESK